MEHIDTTEGADSSSAMEGEELVGSRLSVESGESWLALQSPSRVLHWHSDRLTQLARWPGLFGLFGLPWLMGAGLWVHINKGYLVAVLASSALLVWVIWMMRRRLRVVLTGQTLRIQQPLIRPRMAPFLYLRRLFKIDGDKPRPIRHAHFEVDLRGIETAAVARRHSWKNDGSLTYHLDVFAERGCWMLGGKIELDNGVEGPFSFELNLNERECRWLAEQINASIAAA